MSFGQFILYLLAIAVWAAVLSLWIFAMVDLFQRGDLSGGWKAVWLVVIVLLPVVGTCIYFIARPNLPPRYVSERVESMQAERADTQPWHYESSSAEQLRTLSELMDKGRISPEEFEAEKARILRSQSSSPAPAS